MNLGVQCGTPETNLSSMNLKLTSGSATSALTFEAVESVRCEVGYLWTDANSTKFIVCTAFGTWTAVPLCSRIFQ